MKSMRTVCHSARGSVLIFTLLGLLAVVAAFIYLPPLFSRFDAGAARARSADNLLQWGIALNLYLADNADYLPEVGGQTASADLPQAWYNALPEYLSLEPLTARAPGARPRPGMRSIWIDPLATTREAQRIGSGFFFSYGMNYWLQPNPEQPSLRIEHLANPLQTIFLTTVGGLAPGVHPSSVVFRANAHRGGAEKNPDAEAPVLFADGHVEWKTRRQIAPSEGKDYLPFWRPFEGSPEPDYPELDIPPLPSSGALLAD